MTLDLEKLRVETLALLDGTTPGPWAISRYAETHISAVSRPVCSAGGYSDNSRRPEDVRDENVANTRLIAAAPKLAADTLRLLDEIERLRAENETAVRRSAEWMRNRIAELARQTAANIIAESAGGPRHRRGYEAGRAAAFEIMARTILAVPLPANGAALAEGGPDDR